MLDVAHTIQQASRSRASRLHRQNDAEKSTGGSISSFWSGEFRLYYIYIPCPRSGLKEHSSLISYRYTIDLFKYLPTMQILRQKNASTVDVEPCGGNESDGSTDLASTTSILSELSRTPSLDFSDTDEDVDSILSELSRTPSLDFSDTDEDVDSILSELSRTPSLDFSDTDEDVDAVLFEHPLEALPSWEMIDNLKSRYFASVFPLFYSFPPAQLEGEYLIFRQHPDVAPLPWLSLLFAILALACRTEENSQRRPLSDMLSIKYEEVACDCLSIHYPPFEPSTIALKAVILIIYNRVHRGEDVSKDLHSAYDMAISMSCQQCSTQPMACEEHRILWIGLKMLCSMNFQVHGHCHDPEVSRSIRLLTGIDYEKPVKVHNLSISTKASTLPEKTFTMLQFQVLKMSDTIAMSMQHDLLSEWTLPGVIGELSHMEKYYSELSTRLDGSDLQLGFWKGSFDILQYTVQYLLQRLYMPYLEKYLDGDTTPDSQSAAIKCIRCARATLRLFSSLTGNQHLKAFTWYFRGFGAYYAAMSRRTLDRGEGLF
ncbi:unnamed protein product [Penicillium egyptiacum]|uniref:Transcription factor domain-containing protein n=1 Tax=Penicillium egyptiacum TaxID=1303716 RepID=A0A9W4K494_9EURO|nr:unnamed protein product [Penicillium egyptiacum]